MTAMPTNWDSDEELLADLAEALRAEREVPPRFVELGKAAFAWHNVDVELAALSYDSATAGTSVLAGTRADQAGPRAMTFTAGELTIELEVTADALLGQVVPPRPGAIEVQHKDGRTSATGVDEVGWFAIRPRPAGLFRLRLTTSDGGTVLTEWTTL
jgi:hypothetical protein